MIFNMNGGGTKLFAAIGVTYPAGSTVTCTNGAKTLTAKNTSGQWVFAIPEPGTWTVTATDGTNTKSRNVEISSEGQFESIELSYLVPTEYQAVEYLKSTGTQYIATGIYDTDYLRSFEIELKNVSTSTASGTLAICGGFDAGWANTLPTILINNSKWAFYAHGSERTGTATVATNTMYKLGMALNKTAKTYSGFVNGNAVFNNASLGSSVTTSKDIYLFAAHYTTGYWKGTIGETIITCDGVIKRHYIPCYRTSDSAAGMWDKVSKTFFTNAGTGTFVVGADI